MATTAAPQVFTQIPHSHIHNVESETKANEGLRTSITEITVPDSNDKENGIAFWSEYCIPVVTSLLKNINSYTASQQESHIQYLKDHLIPALGPAPTRAQPKYLLTPTGSPFEVSLNLSDKGKPCLRYNFDPKLPTLDSQTPDSANPLTGIAGAINADTTWFKQLQSTFSLSSAEVASITAMMPAETAHIPQCFMAFDLAGGTRAMKSYFSPIMKHMVTSNASDATCIATLKNLDPGLRPALAFIEAYTPLTQSPPLIQVLGIDCLGVEKGARVKIYTTLPRNSFAAVRDHITFGGAKTDAATRRGVAVLRELWHLYINEPDTTLEGAAFDEFEKAVRIPPAVGGHPGMTCSWELKSGVDEPEVKLYVPLWQYAASDGEIVGNLEKMFRMRGWQWGGEGEYAKVVGEAFGKDVLDDNVHTPIVHTYASFQFSEKKGAYITAYYSPYNKGLNYKEKVWGI